MRKFRPAQPTQEFRCLRSTSKERGTSGTRRRQLRPRQQGSTCRRQINLRHRRILLDRFLLLHLIRPQPPLSPYRPHLISYLIVIERLSRPLPVSIRLHRFPLQLQPDLPQFPFLSISTPPSKPPHPLLLRRQRRTTLCLSRQRCHSPLLVRRRVLPLFLPVRPQVDDQPLLRLDVLLRLRLQLLLPFKRTGALRHRPLARGSKREKLRVSLRLG